MTETERKALALVNDVCRERSRPKWTCIERATHSASEALCRAIEQHEAFRQEVSDEIVKLGCWPDTINLQRFIITKPDPLVEAMRYITAFDDAKAAEQLRAELAKRGLEIREKK